MLSVANYIYQAKVSSDFLKNHLFVANYQEKKSPLRVLFCCRQKGVITCTAFIIIGCLKKKALSVTNMLHQNIIIIIRVQH